MKQKKSDSSRQSGSSGLISVKRDRMSGMMDGARAYSEGFAAYRRHFEIQEGCAWLARVLELPVLLN